jgi:inner membrane protein YidH
MPGKDPQPAAPVRDTNQLALDRTRLAYERTLLAWIRTATGLITFGFSIYKFFQVQHEAAGQAVPHHLFGSREFAILTIGLGLTALLLATIEHRGNMRALHLQGVKARISLAGIFAALLSILGIIGMVIAILRQ